jgi:hypothetical protein
MENDNRREMCTLSTAVDSCILMYEEGKTRIAMETLSNLGFSLMSVHRILKNPEQRRHYINDLVTGF